MTFHTTGGLRPSTIPARFLELVLEPLPDAILVDTEHNYLLRQARRQLWLRADALTRLVSAKLRLLQASDRMCGYTGAQRSSHKMYDAAVKEWRATTAAQILVPAPDKEAVAWKRRAAKDSYLPIETDDVEAAIAADEAWIAAHPVRRTKAKHPD